MIFLTRTWSFSDVRWKLRLLFQSDIDDLTNWYRVAWCLGIWDRDIRAQYHGVTRIHINKTSVLLIAHPWSTFSLKPDDINPIIVSESIPSSGKIRK